MKATIRDRAALASISPIDIGAYLRNSGWSLTESWEEKASIWTKHDGSTAGDYEVMLPQQRTFRDFPERVAELLQTLEVAENRSQIEILSDMTLASADVVRIRVPNSDNADGTLAFDQGVGLIEHARDLFRAAACAAVKPKARYHSRRFDRANQYVGSLRLGQTERGSYVVTVISKVAAAMVVPDPAGTPLDVEDPFERRAIVTLARSVASAKRAASTFAASQQFSLFQDAIKDGVSSNLCDALVGLVGEDGAVRRLELSFSWSHGRPLSSPVPSQVELNGDLVPILREASRVFKELSPLEDFELVGQVITLHRHHEQAGPGRVTVEALVEDRIRNVNIEPDEASYSRAAMAHDKRLPIYCEGELAKVQRSYRLNNPRSFDLYRNDDDASATLA
jgi:hypothetical protein